MRIDPHAVIRFRQRSRSRRSDSAIVETLKRMCRDWRYLEPDRRTGAVKMYSAGWVLVVVSDVVKTVYREH